LHKKTKKQVGHFEQIVTERKKEKASVSLCQEEGEEASKSRSSSSSRKLVLKKSAMF
jgi:hypothetical protein